MGSQGGADEIVTWKEQIVRGICGGTCSHYLLSLAVFEERPPRDAAAMNPNARRTAIVVTYLR
jgi:hypothetical protein